MSVKISTEDELIQAKPIPTVKRGKIDQKEYSGGNRYKLRSPITIIISPVIQIQWNLPKRSHRYPANHVPETNPTVDELNISPP